MTELTIYTQHHHSYLGFVQFVYISHTIDLTVILTILSVFGVTEPSPIFISETVQESSNSKFHQPLLAMVLFQDPIYWLGHHYHLHPWSCSYQKKHQNPDIDRLRPHTIANNVLTLGPFRPSSVALIRFAHAAADPGVGSAISEYSHINSSLQDSAS